jgi:hypothetical protein
MNIKKLVILGAVAFGSNFGMAQCLTTVDREGYFKREFNTCEQVLNIVTHDIDEKFDYLVENRTASGTLFQALDEARKPNASIEAKQIRKIYLEERTKIINAFMKSHNYDKMKADSKESDFQNVDYSLARLTRDPALLPKTKSQVLETMQKLKEPLKKFASKKMDF